MSKNAPSVDDDISIRNFLEKINTVQGAEANAAAKTVLTNKRKPYKRAFIKNISYCFASIRHTIDVYAVVMWISPSLYSRPTSTFARFSFFHTEPSSAHNCA